MAYEEEAKALAGAKPKKKPPGAGDEGADPAADDGDGADEEMGGLDDVEDSAADELASLAGVEDKAAFKSALSDYVKACVQKALDKGG